MASRAITQVAAAAGLLLLTAALHAAGIAPAAGERPLADAEIASFLDRIQGAWQGQAVLAPIGPRPYDISFARNAAGEIEGAAEPGGATHTWTFHRDGEGLKLRFLTTFRGNREPMLLTARGEWDGTLVFRALRPEFLSVRMRVETQILVIRVFHGDRLHVEIRLRR
jgi:hypothetical protein